MPNGWAAGPESKATHFLRNDERLCGPDRTVHGYRHMAPLPVNRYGRPCTRCLSVLMREGHTHFAPSDVIEKEKTRMNCGIGTHCVFCGLRVIFCSEPLRKRMIEEQGAVKLSFDDEPIVYADSPKNWPAGEPKPLEVAA